jgi:putative salt-induced outer membrane protein YdiY
MKPGGFVFLLFAAAISFFLVAGEKEEKNWEGSLALSLNFTDGNSNSSLQRFSMDATRKIGKDSLNYVAEYNEGRSEGETTLRNSLFSLKYRYALSKRSYLYLGEKMQKDSFKNLNARHDVTLGYGKSLVKEEKTKLDAEAGLAWVYEDYERSGVKSSSDDYWALRFGERFSHRFENGVEIFQKGEYTPSVEDSAKYSLESEQGLRTKISGAWSLENSVKLTYVNNVPEDDKGNPILRDNDHAVRRLDTSYFVGLTYSF